MLQGLIPANTWREQHIAIYKALDSIGKVSFYLVQFVVESRGKARTI